MPTAPLIAFMAVADQATVTVHASSPTVLPWLFLALLAALLAVVVILKPLRVMSRERLGLVVATGVLLPVLGTIFAIVYLTWATRKPASLAADR